MIWLLWTAQALAFGMILACALAIRRTALTRPPIVKVREELAELADGLEMQRALVKKLSQRLTMREYRERVADEVQPEGSPAPKLRRGGNGGEPDWQKDPQGYIAFHERRLRSGRID